MRIEWSPRAVADLQSISEYIEQDRSLDAANRVARSIYNAARTGAGWLPYLVVYLTSAHRVVILNILHGAQRWP
jgi:plasmid stabilization system protein ParE